MSNVDSAKAAYDAFGRGDLGTLKESFAEDAVWVTSDELPLGGHQRPATRSLGASRRFPTTGPRSSAGRREFINSGGDWVVVRGTQRASNDKGSFEAPFAHLLKFQDGKTVRGEFHTDSAKAAKLLS